MSAKLPRDKCTPIVKLFFDYYHSFEGFVNWKVKSIKITRKISILKQTSKSTILNLDFGVLSLLPVVLLGYFLEIAHSCLRFHFHFHSYLHSYFHFHSPSHF